MQVLRLGGWGRMRLDSGSTAITRPTDRELEVLELIAEGLANRLIAEKLWITERTVKYHINGLLRKLHARDRAHLVALSFRTGLLTVNCLCGQSEAPDQPIA